MPKQLVHGDGSGSQIDNLRHQVKRHAGRAPDGDSCRAAPNFLGEPSRAAVAAVKPFREVHANSLAVAKRMRQEEPKRQAPTLGDDMHALRRQKLRDLLNHRFKGDRGAFLKSSKLTAGRLSQLLDPSLPFGDRAARNLEQRLRLEPGYLDTMDARTLAFATQFDALPDHVKAQWEQLTSILSGPPKP